MENAIPAFNAPHTSELLLQTALRLQTRSRRRFNRNEMRCVQIPQTASSSPDIRWVPLLMNRIHLLTPSPSIRRSITTQLRPGPGAERPAEATMRSQAGPDGPELVLTPVTDRLMAGTLLAFQVSVVTVCLHVFTPQALSGVLIDGMAPSSGYTS